MLAGNLVNINSKRGQPQSAPLIRLPRPRLHVRQESRGREHNKPNEMPFLSRLFKLSPRLMSNPRL